MSILGALRKDMDPAVKKMLRRKNQLFIDLTDRKPHLPVVGRKFCHEQLVDKTYIMENLRSSITVTRRFLCNGDCFFYFEAPAGADLDVEISLPAIRQVSSFDHLYRQPTYDKRYGQNKISGAFTYLDLETGSALFSKVYRYRPLIKQYADGDHSTVYELLEETEGIAPSGPSMLRAFLSENVGEFSFFVLYSDEKLFADPANLQSYIECYYDGIFHNNVWNSFFIRPDGTYTKLPYSIEPFSKDAYGFNLMHSVKKDFIQLYKDTQEHFYQDFLENALYQVYLFQPREKGAIYTTYTSTWLKKDTGLVSPYIDTRLNESFALMFEDARTLLASFSQFEPLHDYADYLADYYEQKRPLYQQGSGIFFPDYFKEEYLPITHASLNHQLATIILLLRAHSRYGEPRYLALAEAMLDFLENTARWWLNPSGDLYYGVRMREDGGLYFYGDDYVYVTLNDLLILKANCEACGLRQKARCLDALIDAKVTFLRSTPYDIFNPQAPTMSGERINSREVALRMYKKLFMRIN